MTPTIALTLTILFVLYAFLMDFRRKSDVSHALWISLIWMIYSAAKPISFWIFGGSNAKDELYYMEGSPVDRNIFSILILLSLIVLIKRKVKWRSILKSNPLIILWFLYCGISISWSDFPTVSFKRWIKEIGLLLSVLVVLTENDPIEAVKTIFRRVSYILIPFSILLIIYFPKLGVKYDFYSGSVSYGGVSWNKNGLGRICLVSGVFFFWNLATMKRIKNSANNKISTNKKEGVFIQYLFIIMTLALLLIVRSATSSAAFIMGIFILVALGFKAINKNVKLLGTFIVIAFIIGLVLQTSFDLIGMYVKSQGRNLTFTGRTFLWNDLLAFRTNPLIGVGYGSFWLGERLTIIWEKYVWLPNESHNGYLNVYLELGTVGLCLLAGVIFFTFRNIRKTLIYNFDYGRFQMAILFITLLYNLMEDAFGRMTLIWFVFLLTAINIPQGSTLPYSEKVVDLRSSSVRRK